MRKIELVHGQAAASGLIAAELIRLMSALSFEVKNEMIALAADGILHRFGDVNQADLKAFSGMLVRGEIGGTIYRLDARSMILLFAEYYDLRCWEMEQIIQRREDSWRINTEKPTTEAIQKAYARMKEENSENPKRDKPDGQALIEAEKWQTCDHDWVDTSDGKECVKCKSIIYL